ncbi:hypothetical protein DUI87_20698 [Hirundo rustica rustica]|uniref:ribonuclease H n=1 Tax=Hirundo rustica rustica TaxID=333673 RepID=A0A3M0JRP6_HIRRU|nr:hypothetical protein DUI87_20698 [Hirundo rustica rustica]
MKRNYTETVLDMVKELRAYTDAVHGPTHARIAALETQVRGLADKMEENHKKFREEIKENILQISAVQLVCKSDGEWRLTVDYRALNEVAPPLSAAVPDMLELQYELESKAAKWYATIDIANAFFSIALAAECKPQFAFT